MRLTDTTRCLGCLGTVGCQWLRAVAGPSKLGRRLLVARQQGCCGRRRCRGHGSGCHTRTLHMTVWQRTGKSNRHSRTAFFSPTAARMPGRRQAMLPSNGSVSLAAAAPPLLRCQSPCCPPANPSRHGPQTHLGRAILRAAALVLRSTGPLQGWTAKQSNRGVEGNTSSSVSGLHGRQCSRWQQPDRGGALLVQ